MEIEQIKETIMAWDTMLSQRMKKYIHYRSMRNFVLHYDEIQSQNVQDKISLLLSDYIKEVEGSDYDFDAESSYYLARKYLSKLSEYYKEYSNFIGVLKIKTVFLWGILGDSLLYLSGLLSNLWYIPVVTVGLFLYYLFIAIFKEPQGRVYGLYY